MSDSWKGKASASGQVSDSVEGKYDDYVPELIDNTQVQQAELKDMAIGDPSLLAPSNENAVLPPSGQVSDSVEGKYDDYVPELIDNTQVQQAELKDMAIGDPSLLAPSNENAALPPAAAVTEPNSQPSESDVEPGKRKIDEKGKGKEVEPSESAAENVEPGKRKIDEKGKGKAVEPSESASENVETGKRKIDEKGKGKEVELSESAAENVEPGKRKIDGKGKGKQVEEKQEDGGGGGGEEEEEEEEEEVKEEAAVRKPKRKKRKGRKQKKRSVRGLLQITEPTELRPEDY